MSEQDGLMREVSEEVRRDNIYGSIVRYKWVIISIVAIVVGGVTFREILSSNQNRNALAQTAAIEAAISETDEAESLSSSIESPNALNLMLSAQRSAEEGDIETALANYDLAATHADEIVLRHLALLNKYEISSEIEPGILAAEGAPYRVNAQLIYAEKLYKNGSEGQAVEIAQSLLNDPEAYGLSSILEALVVSWGGEIVPELDESLVDLEADVQGVDVIDEEGVVENEEQNSN